MLTISENVKTAKNWFGGIRELNGHLHHYPWIEFLCPALCSLWDAPSLTERCKGGAWTREQHAVARMVAHKGNEENSSLMPM